MLRLIYNPYFCYKGYINMIEGCERPKERNIEKCKNVFLNDIKIIVSRGGI